MRSIVLICILSICVFVESLSTDCMYYLNQNRTIVIAHRGACGMLPEHSIAAYTTAFYDGADFIEPDIQITKNGILLIMHNPCMKETTNIESIPEFNNRRVNVTYVGSHREHLYSRSEGDF